MTSQYCKPVWPTVFYTTCFVLGYAYGAEKQLGLYSKAAKQVAEEKTLIQHYNTIRLAKIEREEAIANGEDPKLYDVPKGIRQLARQFKETGL